MAEQQLKIFKVQHPTTEGGSPGKGGQPPQFTFLAMPLVPLLQADPKHHLIRSGTRGNLNLHIDSTQFHVSV